MGSIGNRIPEVGMRFRNSDEAWEFWVQYGGHIGFDVRKRNIIKSRTDGTITSCRFVCSNEGIRRKTQIDHEPKRIRAETRTNCKVRMIVSFDRVTKNFEVTEVDLEHNHLLQLPQTCHLLASQRKISDVQALEIETADDSGIMLKASHEFACRRAGGKFNVGYTLTDQKNHLRTKRQREMAYGQAGSMLKFFRDKIAENPSFQYHLQLDCEEHIANIFWVDAKMLLDYAHFGDVVTFDTTFGTNKEYRPFGIFLGLNQFRETTIFGAALMFDETRDSFIWLFETFLAAHNGQCTVLFVIGSSQLPTVLFVISNALASVASSIQEILNATSAMDKPYKDKENVDPNLQQIDELLRAARLKKKEVPATKLRRKKTWLDKLLKGKRIPLKAIAPTKMEENPKKKKDGVQKKKKNGVQQKKKHDVQPQVLVEKCDNTKEVNMEPQECNAIMSFTHLLTAPPFGEDDLF